MRAREIDLGFDPKEIRRLVDYEEWGAIPPDGDLARGIFLGTVFALCPSGKYYTPWANSNVEDCPRCKGKGTTKGNVCTWCQGMGSREAYLDDMWYEKAQRALDRVGLILENGEGDPCDLFAVEYRDTDTD